MLSLIHKNISKHWCLLLVLIVMVAGVGEVKGQRKCNAANSQQSDIEGVLCLLCSITNPSYSVDNDTLNATNLKVVVGLAATVYQRLIFPTPGTSSDKIVLTMESATALVDLGVLSSITITVMNGSTAVNTYALNSSILNLQLLSGNKKFMITVPASNNFDRVEIRIGAVVGALSTINVYGAELVSPDPTVSATGQSICSGNSTTLTATPLGGTTLQWYSTLTGGTSLQSGNSYTTPVLTSATQTTTTYYIEVSKGTCKKIPRVPVTVTVNPLPTATISGTTSVCQSATSPNITFTGANGTAPYIFTYNINGGTNTTITTTTGNTVTLPVSTGTPGTYNYNLISVKESSAAQCSNNQTGTATVTINPKPPHPTTSISSN